MKIIHTSDIHLASALTARLPAEKVAERRAELTGTLARMVGAASSEGVAAIVIAGDLFDSEKITAKQLDTALSIIECAEEISFFYLPGNHESDVLTKKAAALPKNLHVFGRDWTYFTLGEVTFAGRSETNADMFNTLDLLPDDKNVVVLHGELRDRSGENGVIGIKDAQDRGIDYMALGHYHTYSNQRIDRRGTAVYSGTPEGRGFDETGALGFSLVEIGEEVKHTFVPFAKRTLHEKELDITGLTKNSEILQRINELIRDIPKKDIARVVLTGERELLLRLDAKYVEGTFADKLYYFEIKDKSRLSIKLDDYKYDKSLRGEFIRLCIADTTLSDAERERVIHCGLAALGNEAFDE